MTRRRSGLLLIGMIAFALRAAAAPPPQGSQLQRNENACALCHAESSLWHGDQQRMHVPNASLEQDVHDAAGVNCHDCHGGDPTSFDRDKAHATSVAEGSLWGAFRPVAELQADDTSCFSCHRVEAREMRKGVHSHGGPPRPDGRHDMLRCGACHGTTVHGMKTVKALDSPVYLDHQVQMCGDCHEEEHATYLKTVHGQGLYKSGLLVTAVCADCHGAHGMFYAADRRSTLHVTKVAKTCGKCHEYIEERLQESVHGRGTGPGGDLPDTSNSTSATGRESTLRDGVQRQRNPSCTDCHVGHELLKPHVAQFHLELANRCGNCHPDFTGRYAMSTHGRLTKLGYAAAADCADCHGSHDILPVNDPASPLSTPSKRLAVCQRCHQSAVANFAQFDPHANVEDAENYPQLHWAYVSILGVLYICLAIFLVHGFLWFVRSFARVLLGGRHDTLKAREYAVMRFPPSQRIMYALLLVTFLGLLLTGITLKFGEQPWAKTLAASLGGYRTIAILHLMFAAVAIILCAIHLVRGLMVIVDQRSRRIPWRVIIFGPDSRMLNRKDAGDAVSMTRWFFGLGTRPSFERWTYWEKLDYWAAYLTAILIGGSGLLLWYPNLFCTVLPGHVLNLAQVVHSRIAVLAATLLFISHFYNTHFRPEKFPLDLSAVTGMVDERHLRKYRAMFVERMQREGRYDELRQPAPSQRHLALVLLAGVLVFTIGVGLLALLLVAALGE